MNREQAMLYINGYPPGPQPETHAEVAEYFEVIFGRAPVPEDGDDTQLWYMCVQAVSC